MRQANWHKWPNVCPGQIMNVNKQVVGQLLWAKSNHRESLQMFVRSGSASTVRRRPFAVCLIIAFIIIILFLFFEFTLFFFSSDIFCSFLTTLTRFLPIGVPFYFEPITWGIISLWIWFECAQYESTHEWTNGREHDNDQSNEPIQMIDLDQKANQRDKIPEEKCFSMWIYSCCCSAVVAWKTRFSYRSIRLNAIFGRSNAVSKLMA